MTPRRFQSWVDARIKAAETAHRNNAWLAYHVAALGRVKKMPTFDAFIGRRSGKAKRQTPEQLEAQMRAFFGPAVEEKSE